MLIKNTFDAFDNSDFTKHIETQLVQIHRHCFGSQHWDPRNGMYTVIDIDEMDGYRVRGFLQLSDMKYDKTKAEIYNVCVHPDYRRQGVLGTLLMNLPDKSYYFLQVSFDNPIGCKAYMKYFFCDFVAIGYLTHSDPLSFILGGHPSKPCTPEKTNTLFDTLNAVSEQLKWLHSEGDKLEHYFDHFMKYPYAYKFIKDNYDLVSKVYVLNSEKIKLSDDVVEVLRFNRLRIFGLSDDVFVMMSMFAMYLAPLLKKKTTCLV